MAKVDMSNYFVGSDEDKQVMVGHLKEFLYKVSPYNVKENEEKALSFMTSALTTAKPQYVEMGIMDASINSVDIIVGMHETEEGEIDFYDGE